MEQVYSKTIPSLYNTPEGLVDISRIKLLQGLGSQLKDDAFKDILRTKKGPLPADLYYQIDEKIKPQLDKIGDEIIAVASGDYSGLNELPSPIAFEGEELEDDKGKRFYSNGKKWTERKR